MNRQASRGLPKQITLAVFMLLLIAVIAAQAGPAGTRQASFVATTDTVRDGGGLLTARLARLAFRQPESAVGPDPQTPMLRRH